MRAREGGYERERDGERERERERRHTRAQRHTHTDAHIKHPLLSPLPPPPPTPLHTNTHTHTHTHAHTHTHTHIHTAEFHSPSLTDTDFDAKPMVLLVGQYSVGKTTFIKYLLERDFPGQHCVTLALDCKHARTMSSPNGTFAYTFTH
jgi:ATPase subunit of ABC transporter with duplicated ATPase domains